MQNNTPGPIALQVFYVCLFVCAALVLSIVWSQGAVADRYPFVPKLAATAFIVGLASFLIWLVPFLKGLPERIEKK